MSSTVWINRGMFPLKIGFCPDAKAWKRMLKQMQVEFFPYPTSDGSTTHFTTGRGERTVVVTISPRFDKKTCPIGLTGLLVHEMTHVWQAILECMQETKASSEMEAYGMQHLTQQMFDAFCSTRHVMFKGWKP